MVANTAVITTKHIDFGHVFAEPTYPSHDADGYPGEGIDDVPGSANAKQSQSLLPELHCQQQCPELCKVHSCHSSQYHTETVSQRPKDSSDLCITIEMNEIHCYDDQGYSS